MRTVELGLKMLARYAPSAAHVGDLSGRTITEMCCQAERDGRKRNSVRRTMLRAISLLLRHAWGQAERDRVFAEVDFPSEDDTREVHLTPSEIARLLRYSDELDYRELALVIRMALQTSADRGVLLRGRHAGRLYRGLLVRDLRIWQDNVAGTFSGEVYLIDRKTQHRSRTVPLTDTLCRLLLARVKGKREDDPVFTMTYSQMDFPWKRVREAADLQRVRFKDLRAQTSIYGEEAHIPQTVLQRTMGHSDEAMTRRYQARKASMSVDQATAIEAAMLGEAEQGRREGTKRKRTA